MIEFSVNYMHFGSSIQTVASIAPETIVAVIQIPKKDGECVIETASKTFSVTESYDAVMDKLGEYYYDQAEAMLGMLDPDGFDGSDGEFGNTTSYATPSYGSLQEDYCG